MMERFDIFISGGGIAGLVAAAAFGRAGFSVLLADPAPPPTEPRAQDLRSTAYLQPARALLEEIGIWPHLAPQAVALDALRVIDSRGWPPQITETRRFVPQDLGVDSFGWNLPNGPTRAALAGAIADIAGVTLALGDGFAGLFTRTGEARVTLASGRRAAVRLVVGADGRDSPVRMAAGIGVDMRRYGQKALAFTASHQLPHENTSTEIYNRGGAFTTVPLPDQDGRPASAIVWMQDGPEARRLAELPAEAFDAEMTLRSCAVLGEMRREGPVNLWPVVTQTARSLTAERVALVAEAAHVLPPIGAQGLNTSLHDIATLYDLARDDPDGLGGADMLAAYASARESDIRRRASAIDLFNRVCRSGQAPIQALRRAGLKATHDIAPLRRRIMRAGLGSR